MAPQIPSSSDNAKTSFKTLEEILLKIDLGTQALNGMGILLQPVFETGNEFLERAQRNDVAVLFQFFGQILNEQSLLAQNTLEQLHDHLQHQDFPPHTTKSIE